ncbi:MAG TPA: asparagine synthase (glutamine-hydrolyzing) [Candidatus Udaeobacter sp.]|jgi:asparagine synthase (glutamine-hydrolysing)|nr:asparagine synthase (glutamine-hydrolyzing) [Candidatus Udaeobacter sp.]
MCGIAGVVSFDRREPIEREALARMTHSIAHRGPDDEGFYIAGPVGLGFRRLSIIDLCGGHQPMCNEDETLWIVLNGEIYNFEKLRCELIGRGHQFKTGSDTETILHLYEEHGVDCVKHLRGMFAFAIWDGRRQRLFAARDRLGQKPFYYVHRNRELLFGSEIKALLSVDGGLRQPDLAALDEYLTLRLISPPRSMFKEVRKLPPAHYLTIDSDKGLRIQRYWDLMYEPKWTGSEQDLIDELEERLINCIRLHLISDVPVGAFMSGGLDSTLIVALLMKHGLASDFQTFSVGLPYGQFDEAPAARLIAERYGTRHHEERINPSLLDALPRLVQQLDEPSDPLSVCVDLIAQIARRHVKVVLGGDGGDELFGGYDRYYGNRYADLFARVPSPARRFLIGPALNAVPDGQWYKSVGHQLKWLHRLTFFQGGQRYIESLAYSYINRSFKESLYGQEMKRLQREFDPGALMREAFDHAAASDVVDRMLHADIQSRLPDHPVMIQDRMTMAHGLEARSPFMDHELAEFAARLPVRLKVRGRSLRYIQVQLAKRYLPLEVLARKKQGFSSALPYLLKHELNTLYGLFLRQMELTKDGIVRQSAVNQMLDEHRQGKADHGNRLWLLVNSELWYRMCIQGQTRDFIEDQIHETASTLAAA